MFAPELDFEKQHDGLLGAKVVLSSKTVKKSFSKDGRGREVGRAEPEALF